MPELNKTYCGTVCDLTVNGDGVVKIDSYPVFVKSVIPGDEISFILTVKNKTYGYGKLKKIIKSSENRRTPECPSFSGCGGCTLMSLNYGAQLEFKEKLVLGNLVRIGGCSESEFEYEPIVGAEKEYHYRNKAQFPVGLKNKKAICGFYAPKSHDIVPCENCKIQNDVINLAVAVVMNFLRINKIGLYD